MSALFESEALEASHSEPVELRVLAGEQTGARVVLAPGEYLLGSGEDCSLVLRGAGIAERHALLRFDGEEASIEAFDGMVCNAQGDEVAGMQAISLGLPLELGSVWIAVDREDAPWPDTATDFRRSPAAGGDDEAMEVPGAGIEDSDAAQAEEGTGASGLHHAAKRPHSARKRLAALFAGVMLLALLAFAAWSWWPGHDEPVQASRRAELTSEPQRQPPEELRRIIADYRQDGRLELKWAGKQWVVSGYLPDTDSKRMLLDQLATIGEEDVKAQIWVDAELLEAARRVLATNAVAGETSLRVEKVSVGVATLSGAVASEDKLEATRSALLRGVPGMASVESKALLPGALLQQLKERLAAAGLASRLALVSDAPEVKLTGRLFPDEIAKWESLFVDFNRDYGDVLPISATVTRVIPKPPVGVQTIVGGAVPYIVTDSGQFVNQGGDVQGHTLTAIRDGEVVFEGSKRVKLAR